VALHEGHKWRGGSVDLCDLYGFIKVKLRDLMHGTCTVTLCSSRIIAYSSRVILFSQALRLLLRSDRIYIDLLQHEVCALALMQLSFTLVRIIRIIRVIKIIRVVI
jgi:hypothetical protein